MATRTILLVDDDNSMREIYSYVFKSADFEVLEAKDGLEALSIIKEKKPQVVFTGIMMPNMDGFELLKMMKQSVETKDIPVFINSHLGRDEDQKKAHALGAAEFFVKGMVTPKEVVTMVISFFDRKVYRIEVDASKLDAASMQSDLKVGEYFLEISPNSPGSKEGTVKIIPKQ